MTTTQVTFVGFFLFASAGLAVAAEPSSPGSSPANESARRPAAPDVILQENAEDLGIDGWTVQAAISMVAAAQPELERLRSALHAARDARARGKTASERVLKAEQALRARCKEVLVEIRALLTADQGDVLQALVKQERLDARRS